MKRSSFETVCRFIAAFIFVLSFQFAHAQAGNRIFERRQTYESQMLKALNFNPTGRVIPYDEVPRPWDELSPLEKVFGELSLQAAEILAMDLTPGYTAPKLIDDIGRINEFKGRLNGILCLLVLNVVMHSSDVESNPSILALTEWSTDIYRSLKIRSAKAILDEFQKWKADWCTYEHVSPEECQQQTNGIGALFSSRKVPEALIVKNGMGQTFSEDANAVAMFGALGVAGITATFAGTALSAALGLPVTAAAASLTAAGVGEATVVTTSLLASFGGEGLGASSAGVIGGLGWGGVVAAPITAVILIAVVGTTEGFKVVEQTKIEPMMKMKLGAAISEDDNIRNVLSDSAGRSFFFMGFNEAALKNYERTNPMVDGELRFYCQAGYVSKFNVTYTVNTEKPGNSPSFKNVEVATKELAVGHEENVTLPWNATNITVKGSYLAGDWKEFVNVPIPAPTYMCFTAYGTIFEAKYKNDCPEVGNMTAKSHELTVTQGGGYMAWITLRYFMDGQEVTVYNHKDVGVGWSSKFDIPDLAKDITLSIMMNTGAVNEPWRLIFRKTWPEPPNECVKVFGTIFEGKWNNECSF